MSVSQRMPRPRTTLFVSLALMLSLLSRAARADESELAPEPDSSTAKPGDGARSLSVSGLVPLKELNRRPYSGLWSFDFRLHNYELGVAVSQVSLGGSLQASYFDGMNQLLEQDEITGSLQYGGFFGAYYLPLLGYSPEFSLGLLPMLKLEAGGLYNGSGSSALSERADPKLGTLIELPVFALARLGKHASRYGAWDFSAGAGVGLSLLRVSAGEPISNSASYVAPSLRFELGYGFFQVGYELAISSHDKSFGGSDHLSYQAQTFTLAAVLQPDADD